MSHYGPGVDSMSNRKEYEEYLPGSKRRSVGRADNPATFMFQLLEILGAQSPVALRACLGL